MNRSARPSAGLMALAVAAMAVASSCAQAAIPTRVIGCGSIFDTETSVAIFPDGVVAVAYTSNSESVTVARVGCGGGQYSALTSGGRFSSIAKTSEGHILATYWGYPDPPFSSPGICVALGMGDGDPPVVGLPDTYPYSHPFISVDHLDRPYIGFVDRSMSPNRVMLASFDIPSGSWIWEPVPALEPQNYADIRPFAMTVNNTGYPVVACASGDYGVDTLHVSTKTAGGWISRSHTIGPNGIAYESCLSLAVDSVDAPYVAYANQAGEIVVDRFHLLGVTEQVIPRGDVLLGSKAMVIDDGGNIKIAYAVNGQGVYVSSSDTFWAPQLIDSSEVGRGPGIAYIDDNSWVVSYVAEGEFSSVKIAGPAVQPLGDYDCDSDVDLDDYAEFLGCMNGPSADVGGPSSACLWAFDFDEDGDIDLIDFSAMSQELPIY